MPGLAGQVTVHTSALLLPFAPLPDSAPNLTAPLTFEILTPSSATSS